MKNIIPLTPNITLITKSRVLDKKSGNIFSLSDSKIQAEINNYFLQNYQVVSNISDKVEEIQSLDRQKIEFYHKTSDGLVNFQNGFLIEVYESGSNGVLTRLFLQNVQDPLDENKSINDSFSKYFTLEVDGK